MRWTIGMRVFVALTLTCLVIVGIYAAATRFSFDRGFTDYVQQQEDQQMTMVAGRLASFYRDERSWDRLRNNRRIWDEMLRGLGGADRQGGGPVPAGPDSAVAERRGAGDIDRAGGAAEAEPPGRGGNPAAGLAGRGAAPPPPDPLGLGPRVSLSDADGRLVMGRAPGPNGSRDTAIVVDGEKVGTLAIANATALTESVDLSFATDQRRATLYIAAALLLLIAPIAALVSRQIVRPIRTLATGTRALAGGDYDQRITVIGDDEIGDLARDFNRLAATLARNQQSRRQWVSDISHELRTPLSILSGELQAIEDGVRKFDEGTRKSLQAEVQRLASLVADLHELTVSDEGGLNCQLEPIDVVRVLKETLDSNGLKLAVAGIALELDLPDMSITIAGDESRLEQLFSNLVENTVRYTDDPGVLAVSARIDDERALIEFADSAPGVSDEHLSRLFDRLFRAEASRNRASGGSGLGLSICKSIVDAHGGEISAHQSELGGITIRILLPLAELEGTS